VYTPTSTAQWSSAVFLNWTALGNNSLFVKNLKISAVNEDADLLNGYAQTAFVRLAAANTSPTNGNFAIGNASSRNFIQSHNSQPLDINPLGNNVIINSAAGNVGIGTTSPEVKLEVQGGALIGNGIADNRAVNGLTVGFTSGAVYTSNQDTMDANRTLSLVNESNTTGTYATLSFRTAPLSGSTSMSDLKYVRTGANTGDLIYTNNHNAVWTDRFIIKSDGNVGIGTTTVPYKLTVNSNVGTDTFYASNRVVFGDSIGYDTPYISWVGATEQYKIRIADFAWEEPIFIDTQNAKITGNTFIANTNIGIGTTSPTSALHVKKATPEIKLEAGSTTDSGTMRYNSTTKSIEFIFA